ncbi:MAG: HAMP domain-containing sensor histidine kinase [Patescibacteria group bacterium]|nr:HAMP domain-containing sensor histidine kinase [Patescibacteria group bacterium]
MAKDLENIKSDFITVASHQLRTPISAVRWSLDTLLSGRIGQLSEKQVEVIKEAYHNNDFMAKVVNDLLRVSRLDEKGLKLTPEFINLAQILRGIINQFRDLAKASNCEINLKIKPNLPKIYFDNIQIKPVISALIDNAVMYSRGRAKIEIDLGQVNGFVLLKIKDNGIGIPGDQQDLVFTRFFRGRNAMKTQTEGIGLDLHIIKRIIDGSGGKINFVSKENQGTTFSVYFPTDKKSVVENEVATISKIQAEDLIKKEREFVSITVHELKAPLGITKWSLEMLQNPKSGKLTKQQKELIDQIYRGNERLLVLVRDLLNLSKLQEGKFEIESKIINISDVISDVIKGFKVQAENKKISLNWKNSKTKLPSVNADYNRIAQVATNVVSNAIKYTPENGQVTVLIEPKTGKELKKISDESPVINITNTNKTKGYLVVSVKDTGIGISEDDQKKMFTRFFRSKKVLHSEAEGTGLGLYITKSIINLHQGDIWFTSTLGKGSTFYFSLPVA